MAGLATGAPDELPSPAGRFPRQRRLISAFSHSRRRAKLLLRLAEANTVTLAPGPMEAAGAVDAESAPTAPSENPRTGFPQLPQGVIIWPLSGERSSRWHGLRSSRAKLLLRHLAEANTSRPRLALWKLPELHHRLTFRENPTCPSTRSGPTKVAGEDDEMPAMSSLKIKFAQSLTTSRCDFDFRSDRAAERVERRRRSAVRGNRVVGERAGRSVRRSRSGQPRNASKIVLLY